MSFEGTLVSHQSPKRKFIGNPDLVAHFILTMEETPMEKMIYQPYMTMYNFKESK